MNFQYERFDTFFSACSNLDSLNMGFDARQYYRIVLACRDLRDAMRQELPDASMLNVHTLIRLYQDFQSDEGWLGRLSRRFYSAPFDESFDYEPDLPTTWYQEAKQPAPSRQTLFEVVNAALYAGFTF